MTIYKNRCYGYLRCNQNIDSALPPDYSGPVSLYDRWCTICVDVMFSESSKQQAAILSNSNNTIVQNTSKLSTLPIFSVA